MKTEDLIAAVKLAKGSLSNAEFIPALTHFCFIEGGVYAHNDVTAVLVGLEHGINAGLKGDTLLGVLPTLAADVELLQNKDGTAVQLISSKTKMELAALPPEAFLFEPVEEDVLAEVKLTKDFLRGLARVVETVGDNALHREFTGVCLSHSTDGTVYLYSFDDIRMSRYIDTQVNRKQVGKKWLLPAASCVQLLELCTQLEVADVSLCIGTNWCWADFGVDVIFYTKLMSETPPDYDSEFGDVCPPTKNLVKPPEALALALTRAIVLTEKETRPAVHIKSDGKTLTVSIGKENSRGYFHETFSLAGDKVDLAFSPKKLHQAVAACEQLCFHANGLRADAGRYSCLVAPLIAIETE